MNRKKFSPMGNDLFGDAITIQTNSPIKQKFIFPPFSILNTREGEWQARKAAWLSLGIESEVGRGGNLLKQSDTIFAHSQGLLTKSEYTPEEWAAQIKKLRDLKACQATPGKMSAANLAAQERGEDTGYMKFNGSKDFGTEGSLTTATGTSIFDPVLTELCYDWFCPRGGQIVDPFCGGSVRGIVASMLGMKYWGADLRQEQVDANMEQGQKICHSNMPVWFCGNSLDIIPSAPDADFIFSCPPYFDLEVYSDDPRDLSAMSWEEFLHSYQAIIRMCCERLRPNRFAAFVVGDVRDKDGFYRNFTGETIKAFLDCGLQLYNEAILVNAVGTLALRITRQFNASRKVGKSHQNIYVFCKGDWREAASAVNNPIPPRPVKIPARPTK